MAFVLRNGRYEFIPDSEVNDHSSVNNPNIIGTAIRETNNGIGKLLMSVEALVARQRKPTPQLSSDNKTESLHKQNLKAFKKLEERELVKKNIDIADRTVGKVAAWTPFGGLYDAYSGALLRDYGYNDEATSRAISAGVRMPLDFLASSWALNKPVQFATSTAGALAGDYVADKTNQDGLGRFVLTGIGGAAGAGIPNLTRNISSRFSPDGWFRIGNIEYRPSLSTMSSGIPKVDSRSIWLLLDYPGMLIKSLIKGSPLEKLLSKNGTISVKLLQAYIGKNEVSGIDKELISRVLANHLGETHLDYNTLRQEVLEMIPRFNRVASNGYETYGAKSLGFDTSYNKAANRLFLSEQLPNGEIQWRRRRFPMDPIGEETVISPELVRLEAMEYQKSHPDRFDTFNTFTFESPGIQGNAKHYTPSTLGHTRTYTTKEDPSILHVMESLSDWALSGGISNSVGKRRIELALNFAKQDLESGNYGFNTKEELEQKIADLTELLLGFELDPIKSNMVKNYTSRLILENLNYAALNGQTKMRYPTSDTAAKIEGYSLIVNYNFDELDYVKLILNLSKNNPEVELFLSSTSTLDMKNNLASRLLKEDSNTILNTALEGEPLILDSETLSLLENLRKSLSYTSSYMPKHQTILKKYADFPKLFLKIFGKKTPVRQVTDSKGNSWYEVDVPESYLNGTAEMIFKDGGRIIERFKNYYK